MQKQYPINIDKYKLDRYVLTKKHLTWAASHHIDDGSKEVLVGVEVAIVEGARGVEALAPVDARRARRLQLGPDVVGVRRGIHI